MKHLFVSILTVVSVFAVSAQDDVWGTNDDDTVTNVLVVPLNPDFYMSDADADFQKHTKYRPQEIPGKWRKALDFNLESQLMGKCETRMMLDDTSSDVQKDITAVYGGLSYSYQTPTPLLKEQEKVNFKNVRDKLKKKLDGKKNKEDVTSGELTTEFAQRKKDDQFMQGKAFRDEMIFYYVKKYEVDLILFINQLDVKTVFVEQQDKWAKNYTRQVAVHFNIYDSQANMVWGDVVRVNFNSNSDNMETMIRNTLPMAAEYIGDVIQ